MNDIKRGFFIGLVALLLSAPFAGAGEFISPPVLWKDYDPDWGMCRGALKVANDWLAIWVV